MYLFFGCLWCGMWVGVFLGYWHKRRFVPFALSVRYALECNISVFITQNQPLGVVFG